MKFNADDEAIDGSKVKGLSWSGILSNNSVTANYFRFIKIVYDQALNAL